MLSRTNNASVAARAASMRRLRRRSTPHRLFCSTNGCASFLELDVLAGYASCPVCGYRRRID